VTRGLIIFARQPLPGRVKTRLARDVGLQAATELYTAMLEDVLERAARLNGTRLLVFWEQESGVVPDHPGSPRLEMFRQSCGTLGERMANALTAAFTGGIRTCCIIGSDSPDLPLEYIEQAFLILEKEQADVVFGPAADGGYYLVGMKRLWNRLFEGVVWGGGDVLKTSCERAGELGLRTAQLPGWYDLDTVDDLRRLMLTPDGDAPRTRTFLRSMPEILASQSKECSP